MCIGGGGGIIEGLISQQTLCDCRGTKLSEFIWKILCHDNFFANRIKAKRRKLKHLKTHAQL